MPKLDRDCKCESYIESRVKAYRGEWGTVLFLKWQGVKYTYRLAVLMVQIDILTGLLVIRTFPFP